MAETIQEYLVKLGLKVDKADEARFHNALGSLAKTVTGLYVSLNAAAGAISTAVTKIASSFDELYNASQRTRTSVGHIKSLTYALQQVGGMGPAAIATFEGIASAIRTSPGVESFLRGKGITTRVNGELRDGMAILDDFMKKYGKGQYYVTRQFASLIGIDEKSWEIFTRKYPEIRKFQAEYEAKYRSLGVDPEKAAESSHKLMQSFRDLMSTVEIVSEKLTTELHDILIRWFKEISDWFARHQDDIVGAIKAILRVVEDLARGFSNLVSVVGKVADEFANLATRLTGGDKDSFMSALTTLAEFMVGAMFLGKILGVFSKIKAGWMALLAVPVLGGILAYDYKFGSLAPGAAMGKAAGMGQTKLGPGETTAAPGPGDPFNKYMDKGGAAGQAWGWLKGKGQKALEYLGFKKAGTQGGLEGGKHLAGVHRGLATAIVEAAKESPWGVRVISGSRAGDPRLHGMGLAADVELYDKATGKAIPNYQNAEGAKAYKSYWDSVRRKYIAANPGGENHMRFGGYFSGPRGKYGAFDLMHGDLGGMLGMPQGGGSWENGYDPETQQRWGIDKDGNRVGRQSSYLAAPPLMRGPVSRTASLNQKTEITIIGSTDPAGTSHSLTSATRRASAELLRNSQSAFT